jgi:hypothetical protein
MGRLENLEEVLRRQKFWVVWLKEGDNNTRFFQNSHRRANHIGSLEVDGTFFEDDLEVRDQVVHLCKSLYQEMEVWRPLVLGLDFSSIGKVDKPMLEKKFEKEEVQQALKEMRGDKDTGPNGFTLAIFQQCWQVIEVDIMGLFSRKTMKLVSLKNP